MRLILLFVFVGFAAAFPLNALDNAEEDAADYYFTLMMDDRYVFAEDDGLKTELAKDLRKHLDAILEKIKDAIDHGKVVSEDLQNKLKEIKEKMKSLKIDLGDKGKELLDFIKEKTRDFFKNLLDKLGKKDGLKQEAAEHLTKHVLNIKDISLNDF